MILHLPPLPDAVLAARLPYWDTLKLEHRVCPVCCSDTPKEVVIRPDKLMVSSCCKCNMLYLANIPTNTQLDELYEKYTEYKIGFLPKTHTFNIVDKIRAKRNLYISILNKTGGIKDNIILDVGCSYGNFIKFLSYEGAKVFGVEKDKNAISYLQASGFCVSDQIDTTREYDVITLIQVIEHLQDPSQIIKTTANAVKPDGRILISVPNGGEYREVGDTWVGFRVDLEHLNYFTVHTLAELLKPHGLFIEQFWLHSQPAIVRRCALKNGFPFKSTINKMIYPNHEETGSFVLTVIARKI